jgi:hypothetical protein
MNTESPKRKLQK